MPQTVPGRDAPAAAGELSRLARELGLGACVHSTEALKSELQKIILALHPDKSGGEFRSDGDKARFMKARRAIELLNGGGPDGAAREARQIAGAPHAIADMSAPATSTENEHRLQSRLLAGARERIGRYFAAPKIGSSALGAALLMLVLTADRFEGNPVLGPLLAEQSVLVLLAAVGLALAAAAVALWACERAAVRHAEHLLSESALGELFEQARRCARRQGRIGQLSTFDIRRGIDVLADGRGPSATRRPPPLLRRSLDATTREGITLIQTRRLLARRVIRVVEKPSIEILYEVSPHVAFQTFH